MNKLKFLRKTASAILAAGIIITMPLSAILETTVYAASQSSNITAAGSTYTNAPTTNASSTTGTSSNVEWPAAPEVTSESAILIDADTGAVLYEKDSHRKCYPASTTKILTGLLAIENCSMTDTITFSSTAANSVKVGEDANIGTKAGEEYTIEQALYALLLYSANEVAYGLAEQVSGSLSAFTDLMNAKAKELGAIDSHFSNASGLYDPNHYTTAYDMAMIARDCYNNSTFVNIDSTSTSYTIPPTNKTSTKRTFSHRHKMLKGRAYYYEYCKGGKTGFTDESLYTLVTFAEKDGMRLICVCFRSPDDTTRFVDTRTLFDWGFDSFKKVNSAGSSVSSVFSTSNYYNSDVFNKMKLNFNLNASFITIPNGASTGGIVMDIDKNYDVTNDNGKLSANLNFLYKDNVVGSTTLSITGGNSSEHADSLLPYLENSSDKTTPKVRKCIKINVYVVLGIGIAILIALYIINDVKRSNRRNRHYRNRRRVYR